MLDDILAEYEHDSDNNCPSPTENHHSAASIDQQRSYGRPLPPPPEEAARVIVSYFPRCANGIGDENPSTPANDYDENFPPTTHTQQEPVNADACNNNAAYIDYELARLTDEYHLYEEKQKLASRRSPRRVVSPASPPRDPTPRDRMSRNAPAPPPPPRVFLESRFPEFPEFQLRMTGHGSYHLQDDDQPESYNLDVSYSPEESQDEEGFRSGSTGNLDESGDSEDRSGSEECSSVIEVVPMVKGGVRAVPPTRVSPSGQQERPEDYVAVHPKKYFEDCPASVAPPPAQVYSPQHHDERAKGSKTPTKDRRQYVEQSDNEQRSLADDQIFLMQGDDDDEDDEEEEEDEDEENEEEVMGVMDMTLPPPPAFETSGGEDEDGSDAESPILMDDSEYFYDITRSADDLSNDEDGQEQEMEEDEGTITNHSPVQGTGESGHFALVHQMYREGSLDGLDEKPPEFKPPPPPSSTSTSSRPASAGEPFSSPGSSDQEEEECDESHVRWRLTLPNRGRGLVFGTTILIMNRQQRTIGRPSSAASSIATVSSRSKSTPARGIEPKTVIPTTNVEDESFIADEQESYSVDIGSRSSLSSTSTLTQQRPVSAELLGLDKLPDVRSLVNSFNRKEVKERKAKPAASDRRPSKDYVSTLRKELPLFINVPPVKPPKVKEKATTQSAPSSVSKSAAVPPAIPQPSSSSSTSGVPPAPTFSATLSRVTKSSTLSHFPKSFPSFAAATSRISGAMTLPKREGSRAAKAMAMAMSLPLKAKNSFKNVTRPHTPQMEPTLRQTGGIPSRVSSDDLPRLLSYRMVNTDQLPPTQAPSGSRMIKGATLPRISHEPRRTALTTEFGGTFSPPAGREMMRRTPPPPPPLTKGPPPKIFVEVQPSRSESSCTSSCSCLCTKHQSPCNSPVPPPMPGGQITDATRAINHCHVAAVPRTAIASTSAATDPACCSDDRGCGKGKGVSNQPKKGKRQAQPKKSAEKGGSEQRNNALIMEIQAAIQHRRTNGQDTSEATGSEGEHGTCGNPKVQSIPSTDKDKSLDRKGGLFKGLWRRGKIEN